MATHSHSTRFVLRPVSDRKVGVADGVWWPETRTLSDQLGMLVALWPPEDGRIIRVLYSPPDWDDRPRSVAVGSGRRIKTGSFPRDDTQKLTLSMMNGDRRTISVIAPDTSPDTVAGVLSGIAAGEVSPS